MSLEATMAKKTENNSREEFEPETEVLDKDIIREAKAEIDEFVDESNIYKPVYKQAAEQVVGYAKRRKGISDEFKKVMLNAAENHDLYQEAQRDHEGNIRNLKERAKILHDHTYHALINKIGQKHEKELVNAIVSSKQEDEATPEDIEKLVQEATGLVAKYMGKFHESDDIMDGLDTVIEQKYRISKSDLKKSVYKIEKYNDPGIEGVTNPLAQQYAGSDLQRRLGKFIDKEKDENGEYADNKKGHRDFIKHMKRRLNSQLKLPEIEKTEDVISQLAAIAQDYDRNKNSPDKSYSAV